MTPEKFLLQICGYLVGLPLEVLLILLLVRGAYRQYPFVFAYLTVSFVTTLLEMSLYSEAYLKHDRTAMRLFAEAYWVDEVAVQVLIFALVISLIAQAAAITRSRRVVRLGLSIAAAIFAGVSFLMHYQPRAGVVGGWMTDWVRDLSVGATVLDLGLWMLLIASRKGDRRLLMLSGGLGLQFTGEAIGEALRSMAVPGQTHLLSLSGSVVTMSAELLCLYVWWQTFRSLRTPAAPPMAPEVA